MTLTGHGRAGRVRPHPGGAALLLPVFGARIGEGLAQWFGLGDVFREVWTVARWPALLACILTGIALVYHFAPAARRPWYWITPGSAFAAATWLLTSLGLRVYVTSVGDVNKTYGSIGGVILLVLWLYATVVALLLGAAIDSEIADAQAERGRGEMEAGSGTRGVRNAGEPSVSGTRPRGAETA